MITTIETAIKTINAMRKQINAIDKRIINARNCAEYDALNAEKYVAMCDMQTAVNELNRSLGIAIDIEVEHMSASAFCAASDTMLNRSTVIA